MEITLIGNPVLRIKARHVTTIDQCTLDAISHMTDAVLAKNGLGIAAPQIGISLAICIVRFPIATSDGSFTPGEPRILINPKILNVSDATWEAEEGCLSIPKVYSNVFRPYSITLQYQDTSLQTFIEDFSEWPARIIMHENDHLNGVLFIDRISNQDKKELRSKIEDIKASSRSKK